MGWLWLEQKIKTGWCLCWLVEKEKMLVMMMNMWSSIWKVWLLYVKSIQHNKTPFVLIYSFWTTKWLPRHLIFQLGRSKQRVKVIYLYKCIYITLVHEKKKDLKKHSRHSENWIFWSLIEINFHQQCLLMAMLLHSFPGI